MQKPGKNWRDQRNHRRKVAGTERGLEEHRLRRERRASNPRGEVDQRYGYVNNDRRRRALIRQYLPGAVKLGVLQHVADWDPSRNVYYGVEEDLSPAYRQERGMVPVYMIVPEEVLRARERKGRQK